MRLVSVVAQCVGQADGQFSFATLRTKAQINPMNRPLLV